jgi:hypothetical protein
MVFEDDEVRSCGEERTDFQAWQPKHHFYMSNGIAPFAGRGMMCHDSRRQLESFVCKVIRAGSATDHGPVRPVGKAVTKGTLLAGKATTVRLSWLPPFSAMKHEVQPFAFL